MPMVNRLLTRASLSTQSSLHMGMALDSYTNCTSPLRKYVDFLVHLQIKALLDGGDGKLVEQSTLDTLAQRLANCRAATLEAERWLASKYLARLGKDNREAVIKAHITHVNSSGFVVRLDDNGLEGFVDLRKDPEKFSYDKWTASLTSTTRRFQLEQSVEIHYAGIDQENLHQTLFTLAEGCGLKPPKEEKPQG